MNGGQIRQARGREPHSTSDHPGPDMSPQYLTRLNLRPIANPLALGFGALAIGTTVLAGLQLGWAPSSETATVGIIVLIGVAPMQAVASIFGFLARDGVAATGMGFLSGTWAALGLALLSAKPGSTSDAVGLLLVSVAVLLFIPALGASMGKVVPALVLGGAAIRFGLSGIWQLTGSDSWKTAAGIAGLIVAALALYAAAAMGLEDVAKHSVLPLARRNMGARATGGSLDEQLLDLRHEPGVREQL
jgi:succinate-acetate transporter protein